MNEKELLSKLLKSYPGIVEETYPFPRAHEGKSQVKAIILGADPSHIVNGKTVPMEKVFGLHIDNSPYWRSVKRNMDQISGLNMDNVFVQNLCRNYFSHETTQNKDWLVIAREYWIPFLKKELDERYDSSVPVLMTTEFVLTAALNDNSRKIRAADIYNNQISIPPEDNLLSRELLAFYRHHAYSLEKHKSYRKYLEKKLQ